MQKKHQLALPGTRTINRIDIHGNRSIQPKSIVALPHLRISTNVHLFLRPSLHGNS